MANHKNSSNVFLEKGQGKDIDKMERLIAFIQDSDYIDKLDQFHVCERFGLHYMPDLFRREYRKRFCNYLKEYTTTVATVSKATSIPHKYLCECKAYYEERGLLKVVGFGNCPTTGSPNVHFVLTNTNNWDRPELLPMSNQLDLF